jgi:hypothetical protein
MSESPTSPRTPKQKKHTAKMHASAIVKGVGIDFIVGQMQRCSGHHERNRGTHFMSRVRKHST